MLDSAAIGLIVGFLGRAGPEILKFCDRALDRRHELAMQDKMLAYAQAVPHSKAASEFAASVDAGQLQEVLAAQREAWSQQFNTGNPWLNGISVLVRPVTTGLLLLLYVGVKAQMVCAALRVTPDVMAALDKAYGTMDITILSGVLAFWFVDRGLFKSGK